MSFFSYKEYYDKVAARSYSTYVEVGCFEGDSISYLTKALKPRWRQVKIYGVDVFENVTPEIDPIFSKEVLYWERYDKQLASEGIRDRVTDIRMQSVAASELFKNRNVDFVFLDACKTYVSTMADMKAWYPKISGHGVLAGHDCFTPPVNTALQEFSKSIGRKYKIYPGQAVWEIS